MISIAITATETDLFRQPLKGFSTSPKISLVFSSAHPGWVYASQSDSRLTGKLRSACKHSVQSHIRRCVRFYCGRQHCWLFLLCLPLPSVFFYSNNWTQLDPDRCFTFLSRVRSHQLLFSCYCLARRRLKAVPSGQNAETPPITSSQVHWHLKLHWRLRPLRGVTSSSLLTLTYSHCRRLPKLINTLRVVFLLDTSQHGLKPSSRCPRYLFFGLRS